MAYHHFPYKECRYAPSSGGHNLCRWNRRIPRSVEPRRRGAVLDVQHLAGGIKNIHFLMMMMMMMMMLMMMIMMMVMVMVMVMVMMMMMMISRMQYNNIM